MYRATFRFYDELNDFLPRRQRYSTITHCFDWRASIKDMIESLGVPHCEIMLIVVNGISVGFDAIVQPGDDVHIYPRCEAEGVPNQVALRDPLPEPPAFVLDIHLGRLAAYLRMLGFDTLYGASGNPADFSDETLARVAHDEQRILLSRDIGCLKRRLVIYGYFVRSTNPRRQIAEVLHHFGLRHQVQLFKRCMKCNGLLASVDKETILASLPADTARRYDEFHQCQACGRVYWKGSHYKRMQGLIEEVLG